MYIIPITYYTTYPPNLAAFASYHWLYRRVFLYIHTMNYQSYPPTNWYIQGGVDEWLDQYDAYCRFMERHEARMDEHGIDYPHPTYTGTWGGWWKSPNWVDIENPVEILPT